MLQLTLRMRRTASPSWPPWGYMSSRSQCCRICCATGSPRWASGKSLHFVTLHVQRLIASVEFWTEFCCGVSQLASGYNRSVTLMSLEFVWAGLRLCSFRVHSRLSVLLCPFLAYCPQLCIFHFHAYARACCPAGCRLQP
jgi:hypothetical protein